MNRSGTTCYTVVMPFQKGNQYGKNMLGYKHSEETKKKIREARARQVMTEEHKEAIRKRMAGGNSTSFQEGHVPWNQEGRKVTCTCGAIFIGTSGKQDLCGSVKEKYGCTHARYLERIKEYRVKYRDVRLARYKERRKEVLNWYEGKCVCCGETQTEFLSFEHKNGGGLKERKAGNNSMAVILAKQGKYNLREDITVLCFNCNCAKGFYKKCPHENE